MLAVTEKQHNIVLSALFNQVLAQIALYVVKNYRVKILVGKVLLRMILQVRRFHAELAYPDEIHVLNIQNILHTSLFSFTLKQHLPIS